MLIILCALCATFSALCAQDIIYKASGDSILAKVETIGEENITYRRYDNPAGPVYTIAIQNVMSIRYANGVVEKMSSSTQTIAGVKGSGVVRAVPQEKSNVTYTVSVNKNDPATQNDYQKVLTRSGNTYFYNGNAMNKKEYIEFLQPRCQSAWAKANSGYKTATAGWALLGVGVGLDLAGIIGVLACSTKTVNDAYNGTYNESNLTGVSAFVACYYVGAVCEIACIPTLIVGYTKMHNSVDVYNVSCTAQARPYWSVQAGQNGIGLALNF